MLPSISAIAIPLMDDAMALSLNAQLHQVLVYDGTLDGLSGKKVNGALIAPAWDQ